MSNHHPMEQYHFSAPYSPDSTCQYPEPERRYARIAIDLESIEPLDLTKSNNELLTAYMQSEEEGGYAYQVEFLMNFSYLPRYKAEKLAKREYVRWLLDCRECKEHGHDYDVDSCHSPDSGFEVFTCMRCGESHTVVYY